MHVVKQSEDNLLVVKPSRNFLSLVERYFIKRILWKERTADIKDQLQYWSDVTGLQLNNFQQLDCLADNLYVRKSNNLNLPNGISENDAEKIISLSESAIVNEFKSKDITHPTGKKILKTVSSYMESIVKHNGVVKYVLLSGHDSTITSVMNTLGSPLEEIPGYASRLNFSLFENANQYYIMISYNDRPIFIPACKNNICTLAQFDNLIKHE